MNKTYLPQCYSVYVGGKEVCFFAQNKTHALMTALELFPQLKHHSPAVVLTPEWTSPSINLPPTWKTSSPGGSSAS